MKIVVVSDRHLSGAALTSALGHIPDAFVVATLDRLSAASTYCQKGEVDAVMADAAVLDGYASSVGVPLNERVIQGVRRLTDGHGLTAELAGETSRPWQLAASRSEELSAREREVFVLLGLGLSNRRIAGVMGVTERTVKTHVGRVLAKLELESRLQAGLAAFVYLAG